MIFLVTGRETYTNFMNNHEKISNFDSEGDKVPR